MKKLHQIRLTSGVTLLLSAGAVLTYLQAQPATPQPSDLTRANIEAMAVQKETPSVRIPCCPAYWFNYCIFPGTMGDNTEVNMRVDGAVNC